MTPNLFEARQLDEAALQALARRIAARLTSGDVLLLKGDVGAGKSTFARAAIKSILLEDEDIPSPTFTLVQTYETRNGTLWHCDLYRLTSADEVEELGLSDAFEDAICMIEWPEVLGDIAEKKALSLTFLPSDGGETRSVIAEGDPERWAGLAKVTV